MQLEQETQRHEALTDSDSRDESRATIEATEVQVEAAKARLDELDAAIELEAERYNNAVGPE